LADIPVGSGVVKGKMINRLEHVVRRVEPEVWRYEKDLGDPST
jgi:hypothetical protein